MDSPGPGQGATFTVSFPLMTVRATSPERPVRPLAAKDSDSLDRLPRLDGLLALVVDDEPDTRYLLTTVLEQSGAGVVAAASVREALDILKRSAPDVLVSDIGMPEQDGYALIREVRSLSSEKGGRIPAVALTAHARVEDRLQALSAGYQMHVAKPVEPAELVTILASLLGRGDSAQRQR